MINTFRTLPKEIFIAFSGGVDSVVLFHLAYKQQRRITLLTFDHQNETSDAEVAMAEYYSREFGVPLMISMGEKDIPKRESKENFWAKQRNSWFNSIDGTVCTGHHLNDVAEWYLMTSIADARGGFLTNYENENVIRPLIITPKANIEKYAKHHELNYLTDPTNSDINFNKRNRIRAELLPQVLSFNPGFLNTIRKRILNKEFGQVEEYGN